MSRFYIPTLLEISKYNPLLIHNLLFSKLELLKLIFQYRDQVNPILTINQPIMEYSHILMEP